MASTMATTAAMSTRKRRGASHHRQRRAEESEGGGHAIIGNINLIDLIVMFQVFSCVGVGHRQVLPRGCRLWRWLAAHDGPGSMDR